LKVGSNSKNTNRPRAVAQANNGQQQAIIAIITFKKINKIN